MAAPIINTPGTKPISKVTSIAREIETWARDELGITMSHFYGSTTWADHNNRRCLDAMIAGPKGQQPVWTATGKPLTPAECHTFGDKLYAYVKANAERWGVNGVIWDRHVTGFPHADNPPYRGPYGVKRTYSGPSPHTDHNHIEVDSSPYKAPVKPKPPAKPDPAGDYPRPRTKVVYLDKLRPGVTDSDSVYWLQRALREAGYTSVLKTGAFDADTRAGVRAFQEDHGNAPQYVDGLPGPNDTAAILKAGKTKGIEIRKSSK